jgi:hypothetical protein
VETETNGLVDHLTTLATVEERFLEAVNDWKQYTTGCIGCSVDAVGARNSASQGSCMRMIRPNLRSTEFEGYTIGSASRNSDCDDSKCDAQRLEQHCGSESPKSCKRENENENENAPFLADVNWLIYTTQICC